MNDTTAVTLVWRADPVAYAVAAWLDAKHNRSGSARTLRAYRDTLQSFAQALEALGLDVCSDPRAVADVAQVWAARRADGSQVSASTHNQRLAIVSSFYDFAIRRELLDGLASNPVRRIARRPSQGYASARPLDAATVAERLEAIDRGALAGKRDYALLTVALQTGRRLAELAALQRGDILLSGGRCTLTWRRCKGGKVMHDTLPRAVSDALLAWLYAAYGADLATLPADAPVWLQFSRRQSATRGRQLSERSISNICQARLGTSKVHALRHTFAHSMEAVGAKVSDIQARLGHNSLDTTGRYLAALRSAENQHGDELAALFGVAKASSGRRRKRA